ncbi:MAG: hypothetical protein H0V76_10045 [Blastocatellia bacterium]|nr:hypothetical protein [Blastocatellia bacterium]
MKKLLTFALFTLLASAAFGQTEKGPNPDHASPEAIIKAVYEVISGDAGVERDWDRFRAVFHKDARLIPTGKNPQTGMFNAVSMTPDGYVERAAPGFGKDGFHEREVARKTDRYGNIVHVFSTYEAFRKKDDTKPFMRGINSFQLLFDGKRWWIMTIYWQAETPDNPIPKLYLP